MVTRADPQGRHRDNSIGQCGGEPFKSMLTDMAAFPSQTPNYHERQPLSLFEEARLFERTLANGAWHGVWGASAADWDSGRAHHAY